MTTYWLGNFIIVFVVCSFLTSVYVYQSSLDHELALKKLEISACNEEGGY